MNWWTTVWVCLAALWWATAGVAHAIDDEKKLVVYSVTQQDLNGDGRPDMTIIDCAFATTHDRVYVVDQGVNMQTSENWWEATDFDDDVWLYDIGATGSVKLIVVYGHEDGRAVASIYDDQNGDGQVSHELDETRVKITESPHWTARITSGSTWFFPNRTLNLNVRVTIDGPVVTDRMPSVFAAQNMRHDGTPDLEFEEVADDEGIGRYALTRLLTPSPSDWGFQRASFMSNEGRYPTRLTNRGFFPFLGIPIDPKDPAFVNLRYFDFPPNVNVDWDTGKVRGVGLPGYPIGHGYHWNSNSYIVKGEVNDVSFESPQAYYDLANDHDAFPDLHIRFFTRPAYEASMWFPAGMRRVPWQSIGYDWNLFNPQSLRWDFKVGLGGTRDIDAVVHYPDFAARTVPFAELPRWITVRDWDLLTFVAREGEGYQSSEGIYEWQTDTGEEPENPNNPSEAVREASFGYMMGLRTTAPDLYYQNVRKGFRAERKFDGPAQPYLYFSSLDSKLHLRGSSGGVWNVDDHDTIRYANLQQSPYLDQWQYFQDGVLVRQLNSTGSHLVYSGENTVRVKSETAPPALFETLPPTTHDEWVDLREKLQVNKRDNAAGDFEAMLATAKAPEWRVDGATLRDFRFDGRGFRFVLSLQPDFAVSGEGGLDLTDLTPGEYVVTYHASFVVAPLSPPVLSASLASQTFTYLETKALPLTIHNEGLQDLPPATLEVTATRGEAQATDVITRSVTLLAQQPVELTLPWTPKAPGSWRLTAQVRQPDGQVSPVLATQIEVLPAPAPEAPRTLAASAAFENLPLLLLGLMVVGALAGLIGWREFQSYTMKRIDEPEA